MKSEIIPNSYQIGDVRGPFREKGAIRFLVRGLRGWVPITNYSWECEIETRQRAEEYGRKVKEIALKKTRRKKS